MKHDLTVSKRLEVLLAQQDVRADRIDRLLAAGRQQDAVALLAEFRTVQAAIREAVNLRARRLGVTPPGSIF